MSMDMEPDEPFDPENEIRDEALKAEATEILERAANIDARARKLGLYAEGPPQITMVPTPFGPKPAVVQQFQIGRIAFSDRVQDPDTEKFDDQFRVMEVQAQDDAYLDERERIKRALAEGRDPYEDDEVE